MVDVAGEVQAIQRGVGTGTIPAGEARIGKGTFTVDAGLYRSGAGLPWKVDYDDAGGHRQVVLQGRQQ